ncbi:hypothetical protein Mal48_21510 [Thalassoglobus polymorphus]|uniref:Uncharacterized protein n=1 Tax=Thalassoglobus polymorphus TaxID=2527994 RepID=A0A517QMQ3_9PLAN|nr:hypothetical protein Mal48_21510 [Thalassoglobus polymorphus]
MSRNISPKHFHVEKFRKERFSCGNSHFICVAVRIPISQTAVRKRVRFKHETERSVRARSGNSTTQTFWEICLENLNYVIASGFSAQYFEAVLPVFSAGNQPPCALASDETNLEFQTSTIKRNIPPRMQLIQIDQASRGERCLKKRGSTSQRACYQRASAWYLNDQSQL